jgi:hypothetical protein
VRRARAPLGGGVLLLEPSRFDDDAFEDATDGVSVEGWHRAGGEVVEQRSLAIRIVDG